MALLVPDGVLARFNDEFDPLLSGAILRLYENNKTPAAGDVLADYTESTTPGYAPINLPITVPAAATVASVATKTWLIQTFTFTGAGLIYGYYVTDITGTILLWAERYIAAPFTAALLTTFSVIPVLQLKRF